MPMYFTLDPEKNNTLHPVPPGFFVAVLSGGPHHRQTVRVPRDENTLRYYSGAEPHEYHRLGRAPVYTHTDRLASLLGGGE